MRKLSKILGCCGLLALGWFIGQVSPLIGADPQSGKSAALATTGDKSNVVAYVNGKAITRQELGEELIVRQGKHQLELLINRRIIHEAAQKAGIMVTDAEVDDDLSEVMKLGKFRTPKEFEEHFLKKEKHCTLFEYKEDVVRPGLMMKKLAGKRVEISEDDLKKAFEAIHGEKVQCRIIFEKDLKAAQHTYAEILRSDKGIARAFYDAAKRQANPDLASLAGSVKPIGRHMTFDTVEKRAFELNDGELSEVLEVPGGNIILLREKAVPPEAGKSFAEERETLRQEILERKMRAEVPKIFQELRKQAVVQDFLNKRDSSLINALEQDMKERGGPSK